MLELIDTLHREFGKSIVLSSHLLEDVDRVCDQLLILDRGRVIASGRTEDLRLDLPGRYALTLGGRPEPLLGRLRAEGVTVIGSTRPTSEGWEGQLQAPPGWTPRKLLELLAGSEEGRGAVLRALVPREERLGELFERLTGRGAGASGPGAGRAAAVGASPPAEGEVGP